jgi:hypothetical protein
LNPLYFERHGIHPRSVINSLVQTHCDKILKVVIEYFPQAIRFYTDYYRPYEAYLGPLRRFLYFSQAYFYRFAFPYLWPAYKLGNKTLGMLSADTPNLTTLALLAVVLFVSLKLLNILRKTVLYWISMVIRLATWILVAAVGLYVWHRGVEQTMEDVGWMIGFLAGLENEGENIGNAKAARRTQDARKIPSYGQKGRTRGTGWK